MANYAVGDIQGCFDQLMALLDKLKFKAKDDVLWIAGDLINRGPKNLETINFLRQLPNTKIVLGNHDLHFLAVATGLAKQSKSDTLDDLLTSSDLQDIINWLRQQPLLQRDEKLGVAMVHAGIPAIWSIDQASQYATEVEAVIQSENYQSFLKVMYGNEPASWSEALVGSDRLRIITNYLTRLRYCNPLAQLELTHKTKTAPAAYQAWFEHYPKQTLPSKILFGHWAALEGVCEHNDIIALDTGCVWGRKLTAYHIEAQTFVSVPGYIPDHPPITTKIK